MTSHVLQTGEFEEFNVKSHYETTASLWIFLCGPEFHVVPAKLELCNQYFDNPLASDLKGALQQPLLAQQTEI